MAQERKAREADIKKRDELIDRERKTREAEVRELHKKAAQESEKNQKELSRITSNAFWKYIIGVIVSICVFIAVWIYASWVVKPEVVQVVYREAETGFWDVSFGTLRLTPYVPEVVLVGIGETVIGAVAATGEAILEVGGAVLISYCLDASRKVRVAVSSMNPLVDISDLSNLSRNYQAFASVH